MSVAGWVAGGFQNNSPDGPTSQRTAGAFGWQLPVPNVAFRKDKKLAPNSS